MAYVKIPDPIIIDLAAWQQLINVVNSHSDNIAALTNNFGLTSSPQTGNDWVTSFDGGSQVIVYGRTTVNVASGSNLTKTAVAFESSSFSATPPVVTATVISGTNAKRQAVVTVESVTKTNFTLTVGNLPSSSPPTSVVVNWIAIGAR